MYRIQLITVSHLKAGPWKELSDEYLKRLSPYAKCQVVEVLQVSFGAVSERAQVIVQEAKGILAAVAPDAVLIACHETGKQYTSLQFAKQIDTWSHQGSATLSFVIGGPLGLDASVLMAARTQLSLSSLTFPHDLARVILLEQLYRGITIQHAKTYHY